MGKVDDMRAWNEWREYHRALKRDKAVDKLSPAVERMRRLEKLEKDPVSWMLSLRRIHPASLHFLPEEGDPRITSNPEWYEVLSWSRELAKSTIVFMCASCILY